MKYYIGIDLGGTNIVAGVVDEQFQLLAKASDKTRVGRPAQEIAQTMAQTAQEASDQKGGHDIRKQHQTADISQQYD